MNYTTEQLYEQAKQVARALLEELHWPIENEFSDNFLLTCPECGLPFRNDVQIGLVSEHGKVAHGRKENMKLNLVWIGEGPPPEPNKPRTH